MTTSSSSSTKSSYVYLLESTHTKKTYIGATVDLNHRLRQHNGELVGGAKYTTGRVTQGERWRRIAYVSGFPTWAATLQFEWRWKQLTRRIPNTPRLSSLQKRMLALQTLLQLPRSTTAAIPFATWPTPPQVHMETETETKTETEL